jgi:hypothetical protein
LEPMLLGDAARLRKGLFDERLSVKPADRLPEDWPDGSANMLLEKAAGTLRQVGSI